MSDRVWEWLLDWPMRIDPAAAVTAFFSGTLLAMTTSHDHGVSIAATIVSVGVSCIPLLFVRRWPIPVAMTVAAIEVVLSAIDTRIAISIAISFALYGVAVRTDRRTAWRFGGCIAVILIVAAQAFHPGFDTVGPNFAAGSLTVIGVAIGEAVRSRRELLAGVLERAERAERTKQDEAERQVAAERIRIARDLHDVVAHHITLINAQAGVAYHLLSSNPEHAGQTLIRIRDTSRIALDELRATVGLLRDDGQVAPREPAPGLADLDALVESIRHAGLDIVLDDASQMAEITPIMGLTAYRIIQEALTNTHKHAGPATAWVGLKICDGLLRITVTDNGKPSAATPSAAGNGHGLIGMQERAKAAGGVVTAGPLSSGGYRVVADLPLHASRTVLA